jgi:hypothetical protein
MADNDLSTQITAGVGVAATVWLVFWKCSVRISTKKPAILTEDFHRSPNLQENAGIDLGHDDYPPTLLQFIIHFSYHHSTVYILATDSVVKEPTRNMQIVNDLIHSHE